MGNVHASKMPQFSELWERVSDKDFLDCYSVPAVGMSPRQAADIITDFPGWGRFLLRIRRIVTTPFGLSNDGPDAADKAGIFPIESNNDRELIAGFNDKHLNFRVSVICSEGHVFLATWVHPHNIAGKFYLAAIMPFHIMIARNALARVRVESLNDGSVA